MEFFFVLPERVALEQNPFWQAGSVRIHVKIDLHA